MSPKVAVLSQVRGVRSLTRLPFYGVEGPGSELTVNPLDVERGRPRHKQPDPRPKRRCGSASWETFDDGDSVLEESSPKEVGADLLRHGHARLQSRESRFSEEYDDVRNGP